MLLFFFNPTVLKHSVSCWSDTLQLSHIELNAVKTGNSTDKCDIRFPCRFICIWLFPPLPQPLTCFRSVLICIHVVVLIWRMGKWFPAVGKKVAVLIKCRLKAFVYFNGFSFLGSGSSFNGCYFLVTGVILWIRGRFGESPRLFALASVPLKV